MIDIFEEMLNDYDSSNVDEENAFYHYGMPRRSGRYPWGSGDNPYQHSGDFIARCKELKKQGMSEVEIAKELGFKSTTEYRLEYKIANHDRRKTEAATARSLRDRGLSLDAIAKQMGYKNDSSIRSLLNENTEKRIAEAEGTANFLKSQVDKKGMIDVGEGVERYLNVSRTKFDESLKLLQKQGYEVYSGRIPQITNPKLQTTLKILCPPGSEHKEIYEYENINSVDNYISRDGGKTFDKGFKYPVSMDSKRLDVVYGDQGGSDKDGLIEIRRGVPDLSLGNSVYSQVRILVDDKKYIKGMAVYADDLPEGCDVRFNTNKPSEKGKLGVLKDISSDPENPFGSLIKDGIGEHGGQSMYTDPKTGKEKLSLINKRADEGDWGEWSKKLPSQFLAKQKKELIEKQLNASIAEKEDEFNEIKSLTNPAVRKKMLMSFADDCDASAVHLKAISLPRQSYQVLIPLKSIKDNEVYAPNYKHGETVALVRFPHGGTFEIPILKVNNLNKEGRAVLTTMPKDAVGVNKTVADRLSGADFDGDTVMVIPCNSTRSKVRITSTPQLEGLKGFDPKEVYGGRPEGTFKVMKNTQNEMGRISNLITDMTIRGATDDELSRAVRHSMVVIDAEKHKLDYKASERDNNIPELKKKYQGHYNLEGKYSEGASTLLSRAKGEETVLKSKGSPKIDPDTGKLIVKRVEETYVDKSGKTKVRTEKSTQMAEVDDAYRLSSGSLKEGLYANYANKLKAMANEARKEYVNTKSIPYSPAAKKHYSNEVNSLDAKLNTALKNAPKERLAQIIANSTVKAKKEQNPELDNDKSLLKKVKQQALTSARLRTGSSRKDVEIDLTDDEWKAIQSGAISESKLTKIINYVNPDKLRERATPKASLTLPSVKVNRINALLSSGYTQSEVADMLGLSTSTINKYAKK